MTAGSKVAKRQVVDDWRRYDEITGETPISCSMLGRRDREDAVYAVRRETPGARA